MELNAKRIAIFGAICFTISFALTIFVIVNPSEDYWIRWGPIMVAFSLFFFGVQLIVKAIDWYKTDKEYTQFPKLDHSETE
jgi:hypothetical protein